MNKTKKDIVKKVVDGTNISAVDAKRFLESFLKLIKINLQNKYIKISKFGSFETYITPRRYGRNPKTLKSYIIHEHKKVRFRAHNNTKGDLN